MELVGGIHRDSQNLPEIVEQAIENLNQQDLVLEQIAADAGYSSGEALQFLEEKGLEGWIPNFGQYKPQREGFVYNALHDRYECIKAGSNQAHLPFKGIKTGSTGYQKKTYRSSEKDCNGCPFQKECCGEKTYPPDQLHLAGRSKAPELRAKRS